ncbi:uncharacterized protein LOC141692395 [Apium graveolens]|uniref:uncharacterized protein LOC141692395 n=1 Tax=Apium graveolens TaxID=4045 RepID=UPI003D7A5F69
MPFPLKIQPVDFNSPVDSAFSKPVVKSRFKRLFERPFGNVLRTPVPEKVVTVVGANQVQLSRGVSDEFEPSSVCLANMVQNFIEESNDKTCKNRCYCFTGDRSDCDDDELESNHNSTCEILKSLVMCSSVFERNLLADTASIVAKCKDDVNRKLVTDGLLALGYDASICKARWEKAPSYPAGEYEYVDVIRDNERLIVDIDFRSEFEIARSTKTYNTILQTLPVIFVGKADRLQKIISLVSEAAKQSLRKKGMPLPPWRKADYVKSKWLSPYIRTPPPTPSPSPPLTLKDSTDLKPDSLIPLIGNTNPSISMKEVANSPMKIITPCSTANEGANSPDSSDYGDDTVFTMSEDDEDA